MSVKGIQYLLYIANFFLFLFGWMLIICGAVILNKADMSHCGYVNGTSVYMIVIGCITVVVSLLGLVATSQKNVCLLLVLAGFLFVVFLLCVICLIIAFSLHDKVDDIVVQDMRRDINSTVDITYIDDIQSELGCCGVDSWEDWKNNPAYKAENLPLSCCSGFNSYCSNSLPTFRGQGCREPYKDAVRANLKVLGAVATASAIFVLIVIVLTLMMVHQVRAEYNAV